MGSGGILTPQQTLDSARTVGTQPAPSGFRGALVAIVEGGGLVGGQPAIPGTRHLES